MKSSFHGVAIILFVQFQFLAAVDHAFENRKVVFIHHSGTFDYFKKTFLPYDDPNVASQRLSQLTDAQKEALCMESNAAPIYLLLVDPKNEFDMIMPPDILHGTFEMNGNSLHEDEVDEPPIEPDDMYDFDDHEDEHTANIANYNDKDSDDLKYDERDKEIANYENKGVKGGKANDDDDKTAQSPEKGRTAATSDENDESPEPLRRRNKSFENPVKYGRWDALPVQVQRNPVTGENISAKAVRCTDTHNLIWYLENGYNTNQYFILAKDGTFDKGEATILGMVEPSPTVNQDLSQDPEKLEKDFLENYKLLDGKKGSVCTLSDFITFRICSSIHSVFEKAKPISHRNYVQTTFEGAGQQTVEYTREEEANSKVVEMEECQEARTILLKADKYKPSAPVTENLISCNVNSLQFYVAVDMRNKGAAYVLEKEDYGGAIKYALKARVDNVAALKDVD